MFHYIFPIKSLVVLGFDLFVFCLFSYRLFLKASRLMSYSLWYFFLQAKQHHFVPSSLRHYASGQLISLLALDSIKWLTEQFGTPNWTEHFGEDLTSVEQSRRSAGSTHVYTFQFHIWLSCITSGSSACYPKSFLTLFLRTPVSFTYEFSEILKLTARS